MGPEGGVGVAVNTYELRCDALAHLGLMARLRQEDEARVRVHIDEARADDMVGGVYGPGRLQRGGVTPEDAEDVALDAHGAVVARVAGPVDDEAVGDEEV